MVHVLSSGHSTIIASPANLSTSPPPDDMIFTIIWKYLGNRGHGRAGETMGWTWGQAPSKRTC